jgi:hypothetical protein
MGPWNRLGSRHNASTQKPGRVHARASRETLNEKTPLILPIGKETVMLKRLIFPLLIALAATGTVAAKSWSEKKPFMEWSAREVDQILNESPWVAVSVRGIFLDRRPTYPYPVNWRIVLVTALPVREPYLRRLSFPGDVQARPDFETSVPVNRARKKPEPEEAQYRLQRFMALYPNDIRV